MGRGKDTQKGNNITLVKEEEINTVTDKQTFSCWRLNRHKKFKGSGIEPTVSEILNRMVEYGVYEIPPQKAYLKRVQDHIRVILCNLISAYQTDKDIWISFLLGSGAYKYPRFTKGFRFSHQNVDRVTKFLKSQKYIYFIPGHDDSMGVNPKPSKMRATKKLIDLVKKLRPEEPLLFRDSLPPLETRIDYRNIQTVKMKGVRYLNKAKRLPGKRYKKWLRKPAKIPARYSRRAKQIAKDVMKINALYDAADIDLDLTPEQFRAMNEQLKRDPDKTPVDMNQKYLYRIYHDRRIDRHGRWYGPAYQSIPKEYRQTLMINGDYTVELDYKSLHPTMLYCMEGMSIPSEDLYTLPGYDHDWDNLSDCPFRKLFKLVLLTMINAEGDDEVVGSVCNEWAKKRAKAKAKAKKEGLPNPELPKPPIRLTKINLLQIIQQIKDKHKPIAKYFDDPGIGNQLMYKDSQIMEKVLLHFTDKGIVALPEHDSVIISIEHAEECRQVMKNEFKAVFGQDIRITGSVSEALERGMNRTPVVKRSPRMLELEKCKMCS